MKRLLLIGLVVSLALAAGSAMAQTNDQLLINKSTIYKVAPGSLWTTSLNQLQVITQHRVINTTKIYLNDMPAPLLALKPGYKVVVYYINDPYKTAVIIKAYSSIIITP